MVRKTNRNRLGEVVHSMSNENYIDLDEIPSQEDVIKFSPEEFYEFLRTQVLWNFYEIPEGLIILA